MCPKWALDCSYLSQQSAGGIAPAIPYFQSFWKQNFQNQSYRSLIGSRQGDSKVTALPVGYAQIFSPIHNDQGKISHFSEITDWTTTSSQNLRTPQLAFKFGVKGGTHPSLQKV